MVDGVETVQTRAVLAALTRLGHATNLQLHADLADRLPGFSLPSLHRVTARLLERGAIGSLPTLGASAVLDIRPEPHDHFVCNVCAGIVDLTIPDAAVEAIQEQLGTHLADRGLVVRGTCAVCRADAAGA